MLNVLLQIMEIVGKIVKVLEPVTGESAKGTWKKQEFVLETIEQYPRQVCFEAWGDKIDQFAIQQGQDLKVHIDIASREYNDRWFTTVRAWKVEPAIAGATNTSAASGNAPVANTPAAPQAVNTSTVDEDPFGGAGGDDDLPF